MTDEEIINDAVSRSEQDHLEVTVRSTNNLVKTEGALKAITISIHWAEEHDALLTLRKVRGNIIHKIYHSKKQTKIEIFFCQSIIFLFSNTLRNESTWLCKNVNFICMYQEITLHIMYTPNF